MTCPLALFFDVDGRQLGLGHYVYVVEEGHRVVDVDIGVLLRGRRWAPHLGEEFGGEYVFNGKL